METIHTERQILRPLSEKELEQLELQTRENDWELAKAYGNMLSGCRRFPEQFLWYTAWLIMRQDTGEAVGDACFKGLPPDGCPEIGYGILEGFWGRGYATEAVGALCRWALEQPGVRAVEAETVPENAASQRVLEKLRFTPTGESGEEGPRFRLSPR